MYMIVHLNKQHAHTAHGQDITWPLHYLFAVQIQTFSIDRNVGNHNFIIPLFHNRCVEHITFVEFIINWTKYLARKTCNADLAYQERISTMMKWWILSFLLQFLMLYTSYSQVLFLHNPFTPNNDQFQISTAASPEILHHTVWRTCLFISYSVERLLYYQFSQYLTYTFSLKSDFL